MSYWIDAPSGQLLSTEPYANGNMNYASGMWELLTGEHLWGLESLTPAPGVLSRYWDRRANTSVDDFLARVCKPRFARDFLKYGNRHLGFFNCEGGLKPRQFLYRFPGLVLHAKLMANGRLNWLEQKAWELSVKSGENSTGQDGQIQAAMMRVAAGQSPKRGISQVVAAYTGDPEHPLVIEWKNYE